MTPPQRDSARATTLTMIVATVSMLVVSSSPALAQYRAWYLDDNGWFAEGDVSDGNTKLLPPSWACGLRVDDPSHYLWVDEYGAPVHEGDPAIDMTIWIDNPTTDCPKGFTIEYWNGSATFPHQSGAHYLEIQTAQGARWIDKNGGWPACANCKGVSEVTYFPPETEWSRAAASAFKTVSDAIVDPRRQSGVLAAIAGLDGQVAKLQPVLHTRIMARRLAPVGDLEPSIRELEEASLQALHDARTWAASCEALARAGRYPESFVACTTAGRRVETSDSLLQAARFFMVRPPR